MAALGTSPYLTLLPVLVTALLTAVGWYATYAYAKRREDRSRRVEIVLRHRERQIEELYGPLLSLIEQVFNVWTVRRKVLTAGGRDDETRRRIEDFFWESYFLPLHQEIGALLRTKLYLLEGGRLPESFSAYLEHATQEACQKRLWREKGIDTSSVPGLEWPPRFHAEVRDTLERLQAEYHAGIHRGEGLRIAAAE